MPPDGGWLALMLRLPRTAGHGKPPSAPDQTAREGIREGRKPRARAGPREPSLSQMIPGSCLLKCTIWWLTMVAAMAKVVAMAMVVGMTTVGMTMLAMVVIALVAMAMVAMALVVGMVSP